jgi:hypothetical protein
MHEHRANRILCNSYAKHAIEVLEERRVGIGVGLSKAVLEKKEVPIPLAKRESVATPNIRIFNELQLTK